MRRVGPHSYAEMYFNGCNPSFVETSEGVVMIDSPQQPIDAVRFKERLLEAGPIRCLINTEHHGDHIWGNSFFPEAEVVAHRAMAEVYDNWFEGEHSFAKRAELAKNINDPWLGDPDSVSLLEQVGLTSNRPTRILEADTTIHVGNHTFHCMHTPGHTAGQLAVYVPEEGVVFTGDTVFCRCKTFLQEADPWAWLNSIELIRKLDVEVIVPGHGETCDKRYLDEQAQVIHNWLGAIDRLIDKGMTEDEVAVHIKDVQKTLDPHPMGQRIYELEAWVPGVNARHLYKTLMKRRELGADGNQDSGPAMIPE